MNEQDGQKVLANPQGVETEIKMNPAKRFLRRSMSRNKAYEGQSLVEFAFAIPFLLVLLLVLVEVGFMLRTHTTVTSTVREMARAASAAGSNDPLRWNVSTNTYVPTLSDGNTLAVGVLNIQMGPAELSKVVTGGAELYRAKNWQSPSGAPADNDWNSTFWVVNQASTWDVVRGPTVNGTSNNQNTLYRQVFGKVAGTNLFTASTGFDAVPVQNDIDDAPCTLARCGSFAFRPNDTPNDPYRPLPRQGGHDDQADKQAKFLLNPWYPSFRRNCDVPGGNASTDESVRLSSNPTTHNRYYNSSSAPEFIGARLTYRYNFEFVPNVLMSFFGWQFSGQPGLRISDTAVKLFEPADTANSPLDCTTAGATRTTFLSYTMAKT